MSLKVTQLQFPLYKETGKESCNCTGDILEMEGERIET